MLRLESHRRQLGLGQRLEQLAELLASGTPLAAAAASVAVAERDAELRRKLCSFAARLEQGAPLADAFGALGLASLPTGPDAELALRRYGRHLRRRSELRAAWRRALAYPLLCLAGLCGLFLLGRYSLAPAIEGYYAELGVGALPGLTQNLLSLLRCDWELLIVPPALFLWLLPGLRCRLALWTPLLGGVLRRLLLADLLEGAALRLHLGCSAGHAADEAYEDLPWIAPRACPRGSKTPARVDAEEPSPVERHAPTLGAVLPSAAALRRWRHALAKLGAPRRPHQRPPSLEACLARWRRGVEALPLLAAVHRGDAPEDLAPTAERAAIDLRRGAIARLAVLGPALALLVALGLLLLVNAFQSPLIASGLPAGGM